MALRRKEILKRLDEEGVLTLNKELELPELTQRIAVISSATAAGLETAFRKRYTLAELDVSYYISRLSRLPERSDAASQVPSVYSNHGKQEGYIPPP